eukprot:1245485-Prymnesium_polylepis.1
MMSDDVDSPRSRPTTCCAFSTLDSSPPVGSSQSGRSRRCSQPLRASARDATLRCALALARLSKERSHERGRKPVAPRSLVAAMQARAHRQCAGVAHAGTNFIKSFKPRYHAWAIDLRIWSSSTCCKPARPLYEIRTVSNWARVRREADDSCSANEILRCVIEALREPSTWRVSLIAWEERPRANLSGAETTWSALSLALSFGLASLANRTSCARCMLVKRLCAQRMAHVSASIMTKQAVRGKTPVIFSSAEAPFSSANNAVGAACDTVLRRLYSLVRNLKTLAAVPGVR